MTLKKIRILAISIAVLFIIGVITVAVYAGLQLTKQPQVLQNQAQVVGGNSCSLSGGTIVNFTQTDLLANSGQSASRTSITGNLPAGQYTITIQTYDDHSVVGVQDQPQEQIYLSLRNGTQEIVITGATNDIPNDQDYMVTTVNESLTVPQTINRFVAIHRAYPSSNPNSVVPICVQFQPVTVLTPTPTPAATSTPGPTNLPSGTPTPTDTPPANSSFSSLLSPTPTPLPTSQPLPTGQGSSSSVTITPAPIPTALASSTVASTQTDVLPQSGSISQTLVVILVSMSLISTGYFVHKSSSKS